MFGFPAEPRDQRCSQPKCTGTLKAGDKACPKCRQPRDGAASTQPGPRASNDARAQANRDMLMSLFPDIVIPEPVARDAAGYTSDERDFFESLKGPLTGGMIMPAPRLPFIVPSTQQTQSRHTGENRTPVHQHTLLGTGKSGLPVEPSSSNCLTGENRAPVHQHTPFGTGKSELPVEPSGLGNVDKSNPWGKIGRAWELNDDKRKKISTMVSNPVGGSVTLANELLQLHEKGLQYMHLLEQASRTHDRDAMETYRNLLEFNTNQAANLWWEYRRLYPA